MLGTYRKHFIEQFKPRLHEISAYLIACTCLWMLVFHKDFRHGYLMFVSGFGSMSPFFLALGVIATLGFLLSLVHVFTWREKNQTMKFLMAWFMMGTCSIVSFAVGSEMLTSRTPIAAILPVWNILMSLVIAVQMSSSRYQFLDEDASLIETLVATVLLLAILLVGDLLFHLHWTLVFSMSIFFSTSIVFPVIWAVNHLRRRVLPKNKGLDA